LQDLSDQNAKPVFVPRFENLLHLMKHPRWFVLLDRQFGYQSLQFPLSLENVTYFNLKTLLEVGLYVEMNVAATVSLGFAGFAALDKGKYSTLDGKALSFPGMLLL
jgi:hypothetical protein